MNTSMNKIFIALALVLVAKSASAISIADMPAYANNISVLANSATLNGGYTLTPGTTSAVANLTDAKAATWAYSSDSPASMDLTFGTNIYDNTGPDLSIFFVGYGTHSITLSLHSGNTWTTPTAPTSLLSYTNYCVDNNADGMCIDTADTPKDYPIYVMDIDFDSNNLLGPIDTVRIDLSNASAVPSLIGAYNTKPARVPLQLAVWLFSSGLALLGIVARKNTD
jgi:hypothetical protein